jgi:hypothetical protein
MKSITGGWEFDKIGRLKLKLGELEISLTSFYQMYSTKLKELLRGKFERTCWGLKWMRS